MERHPILAGVAVFLAVLVGMMALGWVFMGNEFFMYKWLAPRQAEVQREVFEESRAFNEGMIQNLRNQKTAYYTTDDAGRAALTSTILHEVADYDIDKLPSDLRQWVKELQQSQNQSLQQPTSTTRTSQFGR